MGNGWALYRDPDVTPHPLEDPTFDPLYGFQNGRKERVMIATEAELEAARVPLQDRDYCSHLLLKFLGCRNENAPFVIKCAHEKHEYLHCQFEDYVLRMKEYERERRLRERKRRIEGREQKELLTA